MTSQNTLFLWTDFCDFWGVRIFTREQRKTQKDFLQGVLDKIVVRPHHNKDKTKQIGHSLDFTFKLKIVDDELEYYDENKKSKGYKIIEGKRIGKSADIINFSTPRNRTKKKSLMDKSSLNSVESQAGNTDQLISTVKPSPLLWNRLE